MRANKLKFLAIAFCSLVAVLCPETQCMDVPEQTTYQKMKSLLDEHLRVNDSLLHSSKDQDIVVVLGATGSGKSTLINYLMGVELRPNDNEEIELVDATNPLAMKIGHVASKSQTLLPQCTSINSLVFYDLPGFDDTRGIEVNLLAGSFIKHIIENSRSTRLVFTAGQDQMTAVKGKYVKELMKISNTLFPHNPGIIDSSLLIVTKSIKDTVETLIPYVQKNFSDIPELSGWLNNRIFPMPKRNFGDGQKNTILQKINQINPFKINHVNIESIYSSDVKTHIKDIISSEMKHFMEQVIDRAPKDYTTVVSISKAKEYFSGKFEEDILQEINASSITILLKPLSESIFESERQEILRLIAQGRDLKIRDIEIHIKDIISSEMNRFMKQVLGQASKDHQTIESVSQAKIYFSGCFENDVLQQINESLITTLLKPLSKNIETIFESERQEILRLIAQDRQLELAKLDVKKAQIEKEGAEAQRRKEKAEQDEKDRLAAIEKAKQEEIIREQQEQIRLVAIEQQELKIQIQRQKNDQEITIREQQIFRILDHYEDLLRYNLTYGDLANVVEVLVKYYKSYEVERLVTQYGDFNSSQARSIFKHLTTERPKNNGGDGYSYMETISSFRTMSDQLAHPYHWVRVYLVQPLKVELLESMGLYKKLRSVDHQRWNEFMGFDNAYDGMIKAWSEHVKNLS